MSVWQQSAVPLGYSELRARQPHRIINLLTITPYDSLSGAITSHGRRVTVELAGVLTACQNQIFQDHLPRMPVRKRSQFAKVAFGARSEAAHRFSLVEDEGPGLRKIPLFQPDRVTVDTTSAITGYRPFRGDQLQVHFDRQLPATERCRRIAAEFRRNRKKQAIGFTRPLGSVKQNQPRSPVPILS